MTCTSRLAAAKPQSHEPHKTTTQAQGPRMQLHSTSAVLFSEGSRPTSTSTNPSLRPSTTKVSSNLFWQDYTRLRLLANANQRSISSTAFYSTTISHKRPRLTESPFDRNHGARREQRGARCAGAYVFPHTAQCSLPILLLFSSHPITFHVVAKLLTLALSLSQNNSKTRSKTSTRSCSKSRPTPPRPHTPPPQP